MGWRGIARLGGISPKLRDDENLLHAALPALRADVTMFTTYTHRPGPSLECPVAVLTGADDPLTPAEETSAWSELTHADTTVHTFPGGHFFVVEQGTPVTRTITGELRRTLPSAAQVRTEDSIRPTPTTPSPPTRSAPPRSAGEPVAVVGIGCRLPGASGPEAYWRLLADGVDVVSDVPNARSGDHGVFAGLPPRLGGDAVPSQGGFIDDVGGFDPAFFGIPSREATRMDPQQRLLLEVAWEALEDALIPPTSLPGLGPGCSSAK